MSTGFILESLANTYEAVMGTKTYQIRETISQGIAEKPKK
jgi:hypothetical protein